ncbi:HAD family hydrolase [Flaviflagellibacter deserti]|uniref:HAD family hydrolase n=1 Tax=Flaviflagellibacter deserti TaxID=2267266 RepID=A0ABV9YYP0_9HYPH
MSYAFRIRTFPGFQALLAAVVSAIVSLGAFGAYAQTDPLPSWNEGVTKQAILDFVVASSTQNNPGFVPPAERIAVFDMDGTLIPERPMPAAIVPILADLKQAVVKNPILQEKPAISALLKGDQAGVLAAGQQGINDIIAAVADGKTTEEVAANVATLMHGAVHPKFDVPFSKAVYQPMMEVLALLRANGFSTWICSGSPVLFTRQMAEEMFGIPPHQVMGSNLETKFVERNGRSVLVFDSLIDHLNDRKGKPVTLNLVLGTRPVFVAGNEGGRGDIAMMRWSKDRVGPSFQLLIDHDDAAREFSYEESDNYSLDAAGKYGFHVVSIRADWKTVVAPAGN